MSRRRLIAVAVVFFATLVTVAAVVYERRSNDAHASAADFAALHNGMTKREVRAAVGRPDQTSFIPYPTQGEVDQGFEECWDYGLDQLPEKPYYQLCFWQGKLTSKARYGR